MCSRETPRSRTEVCRTLEPPLWEYPGGHAAACHHPLNVTGQGRTALRRPSLSPRSASDVPPED
jgi:peptide/nickel transport system ATP-binding protein